MVSKAQYINTELIGLLDDLHTDMQHYLDNDRFDTSLKCVKDIIPEDDEISDDTDDVYCIESQELDQENTIHNTPQFEEALSVPTLPPTTKQAFNFAHDPSKFNKNLNSIELTKSKQEINELNEKLQSLQKKFITIKQTKKETKQELLQTKQLYRYWKQQKLSLKDIKSENTHLKQTYKQLSDKLQSKQSKSTKKRRRSFLIFRRNRK